MFNNTILIPPAVMPEVAPTYHANIAHWRQAAERDQSLAAVLPNKPSENGKPRLFSSLQAAMFALMSDLVSADFKTPLAARIARRVMEAHQHRPQVEQWAVIYTVNGNVSTLPYDQAELRTGFISGSRFNFALVIDLKTYADRVDEAIANTPRVIGAGDAD
ncbi:hypothetical protein GRI43_13665 [Altererythrobacter luteolus]|uniref:Uncharacterized protein n=1 Tax=Pontixanthobacter luteolus TaxID=295089 RepID=A0A6I4V5U8_9SPHN|nr:hypothetical protein [Pontixanthobacter luteolus]MXP48436.1 hypothetical protein [Pontixanthobacter luteolus]